jgi:ubiquinone/menaquinone biosynthesis C-methylase UbiE
LDFIPEDDFYWGEIDLPKMRQINEQVRKENWYSVISQLLPEKLGYIVDPGRLGWLFHCYDPDSNQACLDLGSGWGSLTFYLKDLYKTMYSQDGVIERLEFQALRADSENVHNIRFLRSDFQRIPLPDNSVDLVVLNGVLEWVALRDSHHKPEEIQLDFLVEIRRVLKSEGVVYLGIENRLGAQYFLGAEDHSGYPFTSLLPRAIANLFIKVVAKTGPKNNNSTHVFSNIEPGYRTYTYTKWGYQKLLYLAGFPKISFLWTWPGYSYPRLSGPLDVTGTH